MKTERSDFGKTKVLSLTESSVKIEQVIYFKYKNMLHNISKLSSGAVRSKFNILYAVRQGFIQFIDEVIRNSKESSLACLPESSRFFGFIFHASSFILPQTCSMMFMPGDWAGQSWSTLIFFALRNFDVEMEVYDGAPSCCKIWALFLEYKRQLRLLDILDY